VTEENGATRLVPASHRCVIAQPQAELLGQLAFPAQGQAGDALLFDARLRHCSGINLSDRHRAVIKALFCPAWLRPQMDYSRSVRPEIMERLDHRTRRLLGVGTSPPATVDALRAALAR
jgi:ectoine hydroxylase-related dioxygenase (phytanoyl-CoA dioxygenase family)